MMKTTILLSMICIAFFGFTSLLTRDDPGDTGMPDPGHKSIQKSVEKVNVVYGTEKKTITLRKPDNAYFEILPDNALKPNNSISLKANDSSWRADITSCICRSDGTSTEPFAEYYFNGRLHTSGKDFEYFHQEAAMLGTTHMNKPVMCIISTYKKTNEEQPCKSYFVGFEFDDTVAAENVVKGLMGFKIHMRKRVLSDKELKSLFNQLFFIER